MAHRSITLTRLFVLYIAVALMQAVAAQGGAGSAYRAAAEVARGALVEAQTSGETPHPDRPVWQDAFQAGEAALAVARAGGDPDELVDALRFNARVYAVVGWYSRAFESFDALLVEGGELTTQSVPSAVDGESVPSDRELFVTSTNQLGFARYQAGDTEGAQAYYLTVLEMVPDEPEALRWLGRIAFEQGDAEGARSAGLYFGRLVELYPEDQSAVYYAGLSRDRVEYGVAASDRFQRGIQLYEAGDLEGALVEFKLALVENQRYVNAEVWAGRIELESSRPERAVEHWRNVVAARPDDEGAAWFLGYAETLARWGVEPGELYYRGLGAYEAGDLESATADFQAAAAANDTFVDAFVWAARSLQEADAPLEAIPYWERVLVLDPSDDRAAWYLTRARQALEFGPVAGPAYYDALAHYQAGDPAEAERLLRVAVGANPDFAQAWGYLGRIAFQDGRYAEAEEAYGRAAAAAPEVDDYAFFAGEARALQEADGNDIQPLPPEGDE
ncbi:MAG TPA: tetratricopeptide repeat protein [Trueperaceae bacterium]|nr:tetratricopeptide repeat protein [Trueperaceae bacterium]